MRQVSRSRNPPATLRSISWKSGHGAVKDITCSPSGRAYVLPRRNVGQPHQSARTLAFQFVGVDARHLASSGHGMLASFPPSPACVVGQDDQRRQAVGDHEEGNALDVFLLRIGLFQPASLRQTAPECRTSAEFREKPPRSSGLR